MDRPYNTKGNPIFNWNIQNLKTAVHVEGTLNNPEDLDITGFSIDGKVVRVWNDMEGSKMYTVNDDIFVSSLLMWGDLESVI